MRTHGASAGALKGCLTKVSDSSIQVVCQSEETGRVYKLKDVPGDDRYWHKFKDAVNPWWND